MKLPSTFFYNFFKENTLFVIDGTIYNQNPSSNDGPVLIVGEKKFYFNEGPKLSQLEELYFQNNSSEFKKYGNEVLKNFLSDEKGINVDYHELGQEIEFAELALYGILKNEKKEKTPVKIIQSKQNSCLIEKILDQDCFVLQGKIYSLRKGKDGIFRIKIKNHDYNIHERFDVNLEELEKKYLKNIEEKIYFDLTNSKESLFKKIKGLKEKKELIDIIKKGEFYDEKEELGFKISKEGFFVTKKVKPYVLYEPNNGSYYRFGDMLIGTKLVKQDNLFNWKYPVIINPYIHPALPHAKEAKPYQKICNGKYDYYKAVEGKGFEESVRIVLAAAKRMLLSGYVGEKGAWHFLTEKPFQPLEVKEFDPKEVTNR
jgi:hypothetical protein